MVPEIFTRYQLLATCYPLLLLFPPVDQVILYENRWRGHSPLHLRQDFLDSPLTGIAVFFDDFGRAEPHEPGSEGVEWLRVDFREKVQSRLCKKLKLSATQR